MTSVLTQDVFKGLDPIYKWAAMDSNGLVCAYSEAPVMEHNLNFWRCSTLGVSFLSVGEKDNGAGWENSLIERMPGVFVPAPAPNEWKQPPPIFVPSEVFADLKTAPPVVPCDKHEHWQYPCCRVAGHDGECANLPPPSVPGSFDPNAAAKAAKKAKRKADAKKYHRLLDALDILVSNGEVSRDVWLQIVPKEDQ